ncbi:MAG: hypothetical protein GDA44_03140 [Prochloron sp. SP5CPC1]|nr:hypothetical protein [Candidatus Paraprochloron terpiosi SP5CPC1]
MLKSTIASFGSLYFLSLPLVLPLRAEDATPALTQAESQVTPNNLRSLTQSDSLLSVQGGGRLMDEAADAIENQEYELAASKLDDARKIFNQLSNFYLKLAQSFSGIENRIFEEQRGKARDTAQMRDEATYQLALVYRAKNQPELAVPLLVQVIGSQNPTTELGQKCYQQLLEIGFVDSPYSSEL